MRGYSRFDGNYCRGGPQRNWTCSRGIDAHDGVVTVIDTAGGNVMLFLMVVVLGVPPLR